MGRPLIAIGVPFRRGGFTQITNDYITRVYAEGGTLTDVEKSAINELTLNPDIGEFDRLWVHGLQNEIAARTSVVNALTADLITNVNSTTFTAGEGFQGNGTTMYLDTNYNPNVDGVKYTLNSASLGSYHSGYTSGSTIGAVSGGANYSLTYALSKNFIYVNQDGNGVDLGVLYGDGLLSYERDNSSQVSANFNGVNLGLFSKGSVGVPNNNFYLCAYNSNGAASLYTTAKIAFSSIGSGAIDQAQFYTDVETLKTALGGW